MKKLNIIIGKRQIIISSLVLILGIAVYLNWQFASLDQTLTVMDVFGENSQNSSTSNYGEAELVQTQPSKSDDYFTQARLDKKTSHDEATDDISKLLSSSDISEEQRANATAQVLKIAEMGEQETSIENQVKAKGFEDCVAYVEADRVNVTVKIADMNAQQAAQIKDIIVSTTGISASNIVVTPIQ
ncbi:MAG: SpoIIIAH-like family protein [Oscillospiraceae bacterium]|nr:SpoIIIAH-like family protein [Oscillospiraceae bacterium]